MYRVFVAALVIATGVGGAPEIAAACWRAPVDAQISDPFREPACAWCPGNRGIEYDTSTGAIVRAVATGRVVFAGSVAGTIYVVVEHRNGWRATYGNLQSESFDIGDLVIRGSVIGRTAGRFHFGVRDGSRYVDPSALFGQLVGRPRLIPADGRPANHPPPPRLVCA